MVMSSWIVGVVKAVCDPVAGEFNIGTAHYRKLNSNMIFSTGHAMNGWSGRLTNN